MRFVDLDSFNLISLLRPFCSFGDCCDIEEEIEKNIVDAVKVVRCEDCIHYGCFGRPPFMHHACDRLGVIREVEKDDYCKYGRKENEN